MKLPGQCANMRELRAEIDRTDKELVRLLAQRAAYIERAAAIKAIEKLPPRIPQRVEEVVRNVRALATAEGLDVDLAEGLWRQMIEWSIAREERLMAMD
jgi:isochorismate pyruvate lyase